MKMVNDKMKYHDLAVKCQRYSQGWNIADCEEAIRIVTEAMKDSLLERKSFTLKGFATFTSVIGDKDGKRIGRNPKKPDEEVVIRKRVRPKIIWSKSLKNEMKK